MTNTTPSEDSSFGDDRSPDPNAQGQAALLLIESLIHSLIDNGALTKVQAIEAINCAFEVKEESAGEEKEPTSTLRRSLALLSGMRNSIAAHSGRYDDRPNGGHNGGGTEQGESRQVAIGQPGSEPS